MTTFVTPAGLGEQAEELIRTLPGVVSVRVVDNGEGSIQEVHILTTSEIPGKQTVRNVESALFAHLGLRIDHRRVSVAAVSETPSSASAPRPSTSTSAPPASTPNATAGFNGANGVNGANGSNGANAAHTIPTRKGGHGVDTEGIGVYTPTPGLEGPRRRIYFEDVEVRGSRARGVSCRVSLMKDGTSFIGEARGVDGDRARLELAARASCLAIGDADARDRQFGLEGVRVFEAFDRKFIFVGVTVRYGRNVRLLAGTCEVIDSAETAAVLAVLDATNRWLEYGS
ncbi:MAG: hypothetical protein ACR2MQ_11715 [Gemmatimonadaceae bacterium]